MKIIKFQTRNTQETEKKQWYANLPVKMRLTYQNNLENFSLQTSNMIDEYHAHTLKLYREQEG